MPPRCYVIVIASNIAYHSIPPISILEHFVNISTPYVMYMANEIHAMRIGTSRIVRANILQSIFANDTRRHFIHSININTLSQIETLHMLRIYFTPYTSY